GRPPRGSCLAVARPGVRASARPALYSPHVAPPWPRHRARRQRHARLASGWRTDFDERVPARQSHQPGVASRLWFRRTPRPALRPGLLSLRPARAVSARAARPTNRGDTRRTPSRGGDVAYPCRGVGAPGEGTGLPRRLAKTTALVRGDEVCLLSIDNRHTV